MITRHFESLDFLSHIVINTFDLTMFILQFSKLKGRKLCCWMKQEIAERERKREIFHFKREMRIHFPGSQEVFQSNAKQASDRLKVKLHLQK